jgi:hypothetical protein
MKRILIAFLSVFFANVALADNLLHINSNIVDEIFKKHIPPVKQFQALFEYNQIVKERGGITPDEIRRVCAAAGWQTDFAHAMTDGAKCDAFVEDLVKNASVKFYEVCGKDKSGGKCINDFQALTTNMIQATGLAKLYAYHRDKTEKVVCNNTARTETTNNTSTIRGGMNAGMAPTTSTTTHYVQCKSLDKNIFYEFKFNNTRGTSDSTNHRSFKTGICSVFGYKFQGATKKDNREKSGWDICDGATQNACGMINNALTKAHSGYFASWGPLNRTLSTGKHGKVNEAGAGYELSASQLPYCILTANAGIKYDGTAYERTAFGLDGRYFLSKDIQTQGTAELHEYIRKYVVSRGIQIQEFSCAETYVTVKLAGRSDSDDMITCTINGSTVDFFFDDLSESKTKYVQGAKQALDCIVAGGTFTGKKCVGLNKEQCNKVRNANAVSCPECKQIEWNETEQICELPASASAQNLRRGLTYAAIVGGAAASVVITVGTLGTATAPTAVVLTGLAVELLGAGIELKSQVAIDNKADEFLVKSNQCKSASCAQNLIKDNFQYLADSQNDFTDTEISAIDSEMARLATLIPEDSDFWADIAINSLSMSDNKSGTFDFEHWTPEQIWRAVGITLQMATVITSVGKWIGTKTKTVVNKLSESTKVLKSKTEKVVNVVEHAQDQRVLTAKQLQLQQRLNLIDPNTLNDVDRAYYDLWKKYAPRNQSFKSFKEMGSLQEIRDMSKGWVAWDDIEQFNVIQAKIEKFFANHPGVMDEIGMADDLGPLESKYPELFELYRQQNKLGDLSNLRLHMNGNYSTYDPTLNSKKIVYDNGTTQDKLDKALKEYLHDSEPNANKRYQQKIADAQIEYFSTKLSQDAVDELAALRVEQFDDIINKSPRLQDLRARWYSLSDSEKLDFAQELSDELLLRNGVAYSDLPKVENVYLPSDTKGRFLSTGTHPNDIIDSSVKIDLSKLDSFSDFANTLAHEVGGHGVNALNSNAGMGSQMRYISGGLSGSDNNAYRLEPEEVIAWRTGNAVGATYKPANPIEIGDVLAKPITGQGAHIIDASSHNPIEYERTKQGISKLTEDLYNNKVVLMFDYSEDIRENLSNITDMLRRSGLRIFRASSGHYAITTEQVMKSMM